MIYLEYNSTINCSLMFSGMSARSGLCRYLPPLMFSSHSSQGYLLWLKPARGSLDDLE